MVKLEIALFLAIINQSVNISYHIVWSFMTRFLPVVVFFIICQIVVQVFATISK